MAALLSRAESFRAGLQSLIDKDVEAYGRLSDAVKKSDKNDKELEALYKEAVRVPFEVCMMSAECLRLCKTAAECGNKNLITDTAIAAIFLEGAFFSAKFNVYLNLKFVKDADHVEKIHSALAPLEEELPRLKEDILEICEEVIR
jgi:formiminotetrahydrofolate cyclodeaminase